MMRICLISPKVRSANNSSLLIGNSSTTISDNNLGIGSALATIAALTPVGNDIEIIDENISSIDFNKKYDLVGITAMTQQATRAYEIADTFRENGTRVVIGGIHPTVMPDEAKEHANSVVVGEAEYVWKNLIDDLEKNALKPLYKNDKIVDLADSPVPRFDLLEYEKYETIWIQTSRGCPHDCEFCASTKVYGKNFRRKSVDQIINEIKFVREKCSNVRIGFSDDNFFVNKNITKEILKSIIPLKIRWRCMSDISIADDEELLELAKESGCDTLLVGFESASKESLKGIDRDNWKYKQFDSYPEKIKKIQSYGIGVHGTFVLGLDSDDLSIFKKTISFVSENNLFSSNFLALTPFPGTRLRDRLLEANRILPTGWENYTKKGVNYIPKNMTVEELENGIENIYKEVYNEKTVLNNLRYFKKIYEDLQNK